MEKKKVLVVYAKSTEEVFDRKSALGAQVNCVSNMLISENTEVYVNGVLLTDEVNNKAHLILQSSKFKGLKKIVPRFLKRFIRDNRQWKKMQNLTEDILKADVNYDAILEFYNLGSNTGMVISKKQNIPLIQLYDNSMQQEYQFFNQGKHPFDNERLLEIERESLIGANKIIAYSPTMKDYILKITNNKVKAENVVYHQNVDFTRFDSYPEKINKPEGVINIGFIGSFLKWHEVDLLVEAFEKLMLNGINAELFLLGIGVEFENIKKQVSQSPFKDKINLPGFLDGTELLETKKKFHIGVLSGSNWYNAPNKLFEYGAMKLACIAADTPTVKFIFSNDEVVLFEWKNGNSMYEALEKLCKEDGLIQEKSEQLFEMVAEKYTFKQAQNFYRNLLGVE
jgi:glycosyltransferase involved in cell wall biosynthesis